MRLTKPGPNNSAGTRNLLNNIAAAAIVLAVVLGIVIYYRHRHASSTGANIVSADNSIINDYKKSNDINDRRTLLSAYTEKGDYKSALPIAKDIANKTKAYQDYMTILSLCALHEVPDKQACLQQAVASLKPLLGKLPFASAYGAGGMLEKNNLKKDAADFYQRAYDIYNPSAGGENLMSQDQLKSHIDELRQ